MFSPPYRRLLRRINAKPGSERKRAFAFPVIALQ
jgi:hypothetical protein